jgi:hypothetical protein
LSLRWLSFVSGDLGERSLRVSQTETASRPKGLRAVGFCPGCYQEVTMAFPRGPLRAPATARIRAAVFAVGRRVYVACAGDDRSAHVTLTDHDGKTPLATLGDGTEVAILAWRPDRGGSTRYCVRATDSRLEGWLQVGNLRSTAAAVALAPTAPRAAEPADVGRPVGQ